MQKFAWTLLGVAILACLLCAGCGSSGSTAAPTRVGSVTVRVAWPTADSRFIPSTAQSVVFTIAQEGSSVAVATVAVNRPTTTATLAEVPGGTLTVTATAYPLANGGGTALATGTSTPFVLAGGHVSAPTVTLATTIKTVAITGTASVIDLGRTCKLTASPYDANGQLVLVDDSVWQWTSTNSALATLVADGPSAVATGVAYGSVKITVADREDTVNAVGASYNLTVGPTKTGALIVTLLPADAAKSARFVVDNGDERYASGASVALSPGTHKLTFTDVANYETPAQTTTTVVAGKTTKLTATYRSTVGGVPIEVDR